MNIETGTIRIKSLPNGDAPDEIKQKWIGVEMPCLFYDPHCAGRTVLTRELVPPKPSYVVLQAEALDALAKTAPDAVAWWKSVGYPQEDGLWIFDADCAEVLKRPLTRGELTGEAN